jgi:predicted alpha/beta superfamily hydrolase
MKNSIVIFLILVASVKMLAQLPQPSFGTIERLENFPSKFVQPRNVDVWLPEGYSRAKKYNVIYMHDGQMLFDSTITWNKQEWQVDEKVQGLITNQLIVDCIVVGIWNNNEYRHAEYFPEKAIAFIHNDSIKNQLIIKGLKGMPLADRYLKFIVEELKPEIDKRYSTQTGRENTLIAGSSMGGLISMYAACEYPNVFPDLSALIFAK